MLSSHPRLFIRSFVRSFVRSFIHSFIHSRIAPLCPFIKTNKNFLKSFFLCVCVSPLRVNITNKTVTVSFFMVKRQQRPAISAPNDKCTRSNWDQFQDQHLLDRERL